MSRDAERQQTLLLLKILLCKHTISHANSYDIKYSRLITLLGRHLNSKHIGIRGRREEFKFRDSLGYRVRPCSKYKREDKPHHF